MDCLRPALACQALHWPEPNLQQPSKQRVRVSVLPPQFEMACTLEKLVVPALYLSG